MSGRSGVYGKVVKTYSLGDQMSKPGASVLVLDCGHAVTRGAAQIGARAWCAICTRAEVKDQQEKAKFDRVAHAKAQVKAAKAEADRRNAATTPTADEIRAMVEKMVEARLDEMTRPQVKTNVTTNGITKV